MKIGRFTVRLAVSVLLLAAVAGVPLVSAADAKTDSKTDTSKTSTEVTATSAGSVQGYAADSDLQDGTIVQLVGDKAIKVAPATNKDLQQMYGVTVDPHRLSVTISDASLTHEVFVATSGTFNVLVNTQGGEIKAGDYITMSALDGVGMKAGTDQKTVFGRAAGGFDGKSKSVGSTTLKYDIGGDSETVQIGIIPVAINIQRNPNDKSTKANLPKVLQRIGEAIAEKPIGPMRIYLSIAVTGLSIMVALVTLYAGIRNAIIAIGRNPLSKKSIFRGLAEIILTSFLILIIGLFTVYLLLKL